MGCIMPSARTARKRCILLPGQRPTNRTAHRSNPARLQVATLLARRQPKTGLTCTSDYRPRDAAGAAQPILQAEANALPATHVATTR